MNKAFLEFTKKYPSDPIVKQVFKFLYWEIISMKMVPGTKINMAKLAESLQVSRSTARDAVLMLVDANLVTAKQPQSYYVSYLNIKEMHDLYTARKHIESGAARLLCEKITKSQIKEFRDLLKEMEISTANEDYMNFTALDCKIHEMIVRYCENTFFINFYKTISDITMRYISYTSYTAMADSNNKDTRIFMLPLMLRQHSMIVNSLELGLPDNAATVIENHFNDAVRLQLHPEYFIK